MPARLLAPLLAGCISVGAGPALNTVANDSSVRRIGGGATLGTFGELVEDRLVAQIFYGVDVIPLGDQADAHRVTGVRLTSARADGVGYYGMFAHGTNPPKRPEGSSFIAGAGVAYSRFGRARGGRVWASTTFGASYHKSQQDTIDLGKTGHFIGVEVTMQVGYDRLGPLRQDRSAVIITE